MVRLTKLKETPESLGERYEVIVMKGSARLADRPGRRLRRLLLGRNEPRRLSEDLQGDLRHDPSEASRPYLAAPAAGFVSAGSSHRTCAGVVKDKCHGIRAR